MDLRVYVDGVARIICDLTRTTTVHDIIIALAQYKGKAGRYSLIQRSPDGTQKTLSPQQLTCELIRHPDWAYILQQNPSNKSKSNGQKRSKSLDGQKTVAEKVLPVTSSSEHIRTVQNNKISHGFITLSASNKKRSNNHQPLPSINTNNNNNNPPPLAQHQLYDSPVSQKRPVETQPSPRYSRPRSTVPTENSAFHIVHKSQQQQQQQYTSLLQLLKRQEIEIDHQQKTLTAQESEINYRQTILHQTQLYQDTIQQELKFLEEHDRKLFSECQLFSQEYSTEKLNFEIEYHRQLQTNYENLQQQLARCSSTFDQKTQMQEQLLFNIEQIREEIQQIQTNINNDKKEILQYEYDLERTDSSSKQQDDFGCILDQRNEDIDRFIQQHQKQILELEIELIRFDNLLLHNFVNSSYHFHPTSSSTIVAPVQLELMNSSLLKLCPSGIWV